MLDKRIDLTEAHVEAIEKQLAAHVLLNTQEYAKLNHQMDTAVAALNANTAKSQAIIELYDNLQGAFKVLDYVSKACVWIAKIATAAGILWALWKFAVIEAIMAKKG